MNQAQTPTVKSEDILVRAQDTPNPYALKFIVNAELKSSGKATITSPQECEDLPLISSMFTIPGVKQVYIFQNTMTVTHSGDLSSDLIKEHVMSVIKTRLNVHNPNFKTEEDSSAELSQAKDRSELEPELLQIEEILDRTVRPGLQADGGDVEILEYKNNELRIIYQGACGGCPSAMMGTLDAIQNILRHELDNDQLFVIPI